MPDPAIVFAVFIGLAGAVITALPAIAWYRRRGLRKEALARFLGELGEAAEFRHFRTKLSYGNGFSDRYDGRTASYSFNLSFQIIPFRAVRPFWLKMESLTGERFVERWATRADPEGSDPIAVAAARLLQLRLRRERKADTRPDARVIPIQRLN